MVNKTSSRQGKRQWFATRQVYLRAGQDSQYVELSPLMQVSVAIGFGLIALWLLGASYGALTGFLHSKERASLLDELKATKLELHAAIEETGRISEIEVALAESQAELNKARQSDEAAALSAELEQTKAQLDDLRKRHSQSKAEEAALQAQLEAQLAAGETPDDQPAEVASSLHAQLEDAFAEIETLQKVREEAEAKLAAATSENAAKDDDASRSEALLKAATEEIERLQQTIAETNGQKEELEATHASAINGLTAELEHEREAGGDLQNQVSDLIAELQQERSVASELQDLALTADASLQSGAIAADLKEADLLAAIDGLRDQIDALEANPPAPAVSTDNPELASTESDEAAEAAKTERDGGDDRDVLKLKAELAAAHAEIEVMLKNGLTRPAAEPSADAVDRTAESELEPPPETKQLKSELALAQADIIKLRADVKAAKKRLNEQPESVAATSQQPDNTAKLERQLASTRSRIQQLSKALSDAKLREVAIDLALINVVPSPSPPAPR